MIVQRYAAGVRPAAGVGTRRPTTRERRATRPAIAGRQRLADVLGEHLAVQIMLAMSLVLFVALIYLHQASQVSVLQFNISELQAQQGNLNQVNAQLHATQSGLLAPARIEAAARTLNMTKPDPSTIVWVSVVQPKVAPLTTANADMTAAQSRSEPAAWVRAFVSTVRNSL